MEKYRYVNDIEYKDYKVNVIEMEKSNIRFIFMVSKRISEIEISTKKAIDTHEKETETIMRNIFLLSANEVNGSLGSISLKE